MDMGNAPMNCTIFSLTLMENVICFLLSDRNQNENVICLAMWIIIESLRITLLRFPSQVEEQRNRALDYFYPVVSLHLFVNIIVAISSSYAIFASHNQQVIGKIIVVLGINYTIILRLCHTGDRFVRQVCTIIQKSLYTT